MGQFGNHDLHRQPAGPRVPEKFRVQHAEDRQCDHRVRSGPGGLEGCEGVEGGFGHFFATSDALYWKVCHSLDGKPHWQLCQFCHSWRQPQRKRRKRRLRASSSRVSPASTMRVRATRSIFPLITRRTTRGRSCTRSIRSRGAGRRSSYIKMSRKNTATFWSVRTIRKTVRPRRPRPPLRPFGRTHTAVSPSTKTAFTPWVFPAERASPPPSRSIAIPAP